MNATRFPTNPAALAPSHTIVRVAFATFVSRADLARRGPALDAAATLWPASPNVQTLLRAAETPGTTGDNTGLVATSVRDFLAALPQSAGARLMNEAVNVPMGRGSTLKIPLDDSALDATAPWVEENSRIAVSSGVTAAATLGPVKKLGLILVASRSLARAPGAERLFRFMLESRAAFALDAALFATTAATDAAAAGLLNGVTPITGLGGGDLFAAQTDVGALAQAVADAGGTGALTFITSPARAARLQMLMPQQFPWPILASRAVADDRVVALDPAQLLFGTGGGIDIETTNSALLHMNYEPLEIVSAVPTTADPVRDLWQTDAIALRLLVDVAFAARPGTVQYVTGASW